MLKHCQATANEHRRSRRNLVVASGPSSSALDTTSLNGSTSSTSSSASSTGSVNCSFAGSETSASSSFVLGNPVNAVNQNSTILNPDSRRSSYSSPEPLSMASRTSSYASLSTNGKLNCKNHSFEKYIVKLITIGEINFKKLPICGKIYFFAKLT